MDIKSEELEKYIESSLTAVRRGIERSGGFARAAPIEFDLAVVNSRETGGGLRIFVVDAKGKLKSEHISHIKIKVATEKKKTRRTKRKK